MALTGDRRRALELLGQARDLLDAAHDKEEWMYDFDRSALAAYRGQCHLRLGQPREAMAAFEAGLAELPRGCERRGALLAIGLAEACLHGQELDAAIQRTHQALAVFATSGSTAGLLRVQKFRTLLAAAGYQRQARDLDQQVRSYVTDPA